MMFILSGSAELRCIVVHVGTKYLPWRWVHPINFFVAMARQARPLNFELLVSIMPAGVVEPEHIRSWLQTSPFALHECSWLVMSPGTWHEDPGMIKALASLGSDKRTKLAEVVLTKYENIKARKFYELSQYSRFDIDVYTLYLLAMLLHHDMYDSDQMHILYCTWTTEGGVTRRDYLISCVFELSPFVDGLLDDSIVGIVMEQIGHKVRACMDSATTHPSHDVFLKMVALCEEVGLVANP